MGWLDKAKVWLGVVDAEDVGGEEDAPRAALRVNPRDKGKRPPLEGVAPPPQESLEDVIAAREAGDLVEMRRLLALIDRGAGLRLVFRAAAALEAGETQQVAELLPKIRREAPTWRLPLQIAAALDDAERAARHRAVAAEEGAPAWALAWLDAASPDEARRRQGLVALLFADPALARTVAARDLSVDGVEADARAAKRYVSVAHGRDLIRRFGAAAIADLLER